jgi:heme/copper-type cytochrome/quinol oxidase subunit 2
MVNFKKGGETMELHEKLYGFIAEIVLATTNAYGNYETSLQVGQNATKKLLSITMFPIIIITIIATTALVLSIMSYRNSKKILKMLKEKNDG